MSGTDAAPHDTRAVQRRTVVLLSIAQVFSGLATGAALSVGSLLAVDLSGSDGWAGAVTTSITFGAAIASALLVRLALRRGRRVALSTALLIALVGTATVVVAAESREFWLLLVGALLVGAASSANLQARYAATDLAAPVHRGRDLSFVVWMTTVGSVVGPNLVAPGQSLAALVGLPALSGVFLFSAAAMLVALLVLAIGLRPDPYLRSIADRPATGAAPAGLVAGAAAIWRSRRARSGVLVMLVAHFCMVSIMAMTPVHMTEAGTMLVLVGLTISIHIAGMYGLSPVWGMLADRLGALPVAIGGLVVVLVAGVTAGLSGDDHVATAIGLMLLGLGWSAATVGGAAALVSGVGPEVRLGAQGAADSLMSLAGVVGGASAGVILAGIGYFGLGVVASALCLVAIPVALGGRRVGAS